MTGRFYRQSGKLNFELTHPDLLGWILKQARRRKIGSEVPIFQTTVRLLLGYNGCIANPAFPKNPSFRKANQQYFPSGIINFVHARRGRPLFAHFYLKTPYLSRLTSITAHFCFNSLPDLWSVCSAKIYQLISGISYVPFIGRLNIDPVNTVKL